MIEKERTQMGGKLTGHRIPMGDYHATPAEWANVQKVMESGILTYGPFTQELEKKWAAYHGCKYAVACSSGTAALHVALAAMKEKYEWTDNAEVVVPAITFIASFNSVFHAGLKPVLCDVYMSGILDEKELTEAITSRTVAVMPVHLWGLPHPRIAKIAEFAQARRLKVIEDSCETADNRVGHFGDVACFSLYLCHVVNGAIGGLAITDDKDLAVIMRSLCNHGMGDTFIQPRYKRFNFTRAGYSYRLSEFNAAIALPQLEGIDAILKKRGEIQRMIRNAIFFHGANEFLDYWAGGIMMYPVVLKEDVADLRDSLMEFLDKNGIESRWMMPITNQKVVAESLGNNPEYMDSHWPMARIINQRGLFLPIHPYMTESDCDYIGQKLTEGLTNAI